MNVTVLSLALVLGFVDPPPGVAWNRYETPAFDILSTSADRGRLLADRADGLRGWVLARWGIKSPPAVGRCKLLVANDQTEFGTLFPGKTPPAFRIERDQGRMQGSVVWLAADDKWQTGPLPQMMTEVAWAEFEDHHRVVVPPWARRGVVVLNGHLPGIRVALRGLNDTFERDLPCFWGKDLLTLSADGLGRHPPDQQRLFDAQAACLCLYMMKERPGKFTEFLDASLKQPATAVKVLGLADDAQFDRLVLPYMRQSSACSA
jgi:hypothetical protein